MGVPFQTNLDGLGKVVMINGFFPLALAECLRNRRPRLAWAGRDYGVFGLLDVSIKSASGKPSGKGRFSWG